MCADKPLFKQMLMPVIVIALTTACNWVMAETSGIVHDQNAHHTQESMDWPGIYLGFLPCPDCIGIKTTLALNKNNNYVLMEQFIGKSDREFVEKGKFTWESSNKAITLMPRKSATTRLYIVGENTLTQLDSNGKPYAGEHAKRYVLHRKDVASTPQEHSGH